MKRFVLKSLKAENFKGFTDLFVEFSPNVTNVFGDNETGKTTIYDAFCYCISKKNSAGESDFGIKPNFTTEIVSPSVELECLIDEKPVSLKRVCQAKFTRDKKFSGYVTECFVNGIPKGVKDFDSYISGIVSEDVFKMLTFPNYFTELISPAKGETVSQRQCRVLRSMACVEDDKSIALSENAYKPLVELLDRYDSVDDIQKFYKSEAKRIHSEIDDIPVKIEQQVKNLVKVEKTESQVRSDIELCNQEIHLLKSEFDAVLGTRSDKEEQLIKEISSLKEEIFKTRERFYHGEEFASSDESQKIEELKQKIQESERSLDSDKTALRELESTIMLSARKKSVTEVSLNSLKKELEDKASATENPHAVCPTCGQELPKESVLESLKESINAIEKNLKLRETDLLDLSNQISKSEREKRELVEKIKGLEENIESYKSEIKELESKSKKRWNESKLKLESVVSELNRQIESKAQELESLQSLRLSREKEIKDAYFQKNQEAHAKLQESNRVLMLIEQNKKCQQMIESLEQSRDAFNEQLDKSQMFIDLCERFIQERSSRLETAVNKLFDRTRFKFSRENKSGKVIETCIPTFNGQNYKDLSASTKAICNLDIVKGFQKYYGWLLPVFIDNAEGITESLSVDNQTIMLYVRKENCPECGGETGRKQENGFWKCKKCGREFKKHLKVTPN